MRRSHFIGGTAALLAGAAARPAGAQLVPGTQYVQLLNLAVSVPLSGSDGPYGKQVVDGVHAAVDENNQYAAPLQSVFGVRELDDQNSVGIAMSNVSIASADPSVVATIGNLSGDVIVAALPQYANVSMPLIVPATTADAITTQGYRNVFRLPPSDTMLGSLFGGNAVAQFRPTFALAVAEADAYGAAVSAGFVSGAKSARIKSEVYALPASPNYADAARAILQLSPDYIFLGGKVGTIGAIVGALHDLGYVGKYGLSDGFYAPETIASYGTILNGSWVASSMPPLKRAPGDVRLLADYSQHYGAITTLAAYGYAAAQIAMAAVKRTSATNRGAALTALQQSISYDTILGSFAFDATGNPLQPNIYLYSIDGATFTYQQSALPSSFVL
jgi:branched-chain amino acid transport system substrate-binding protein